MRGAAVKISKTEARKYIYEGFGPEGNKKGGMRERVQN